MRWDEARARILAGAWEAGREIDGSCSRLVAERGNGRPFWRRRWTSDGRYFSAAATKATRGAWPTALTDSEKQAEGGRVSRAQKFHPSYTSMVPAITRADPTRRAPDPDPVTRGRFFAPVAATPSRLMSGTGDNTYIRPRSAPLNSKKNKWLASVPADEPIGSAFPAGIEQRGRFFRGDDGS